MIRAAHVPSRFDSTVYIYSISISHSSILVSIGQSHSSSDLIPSSANRSDNFSYLQKIYLLLMLPDFSFADNNKYKCWVMLDVIWPFIAMLGLCTKSTTTWRTFPLRIKIPPAHQHLPTRWSLNDKVIYYAVQPNNKSRLDLFSVPS